MKHKYAYNEPITTTTTTTTTQNPIELKLLLV